MSLTNQNNILISIRNLYKKFNITPLFVDFSLDIKENSIHALVGPNGSGKTTLIRLILGLLVKDGGTIQVNGNTSTLLENDYLFEELTGSENINLFCQYFGISEGDRREQVDKYIPYLSLQGALSKKVNQYSKGMKRKLSLLITLIRNTDVILLDEPTSGVDPSSRVEIRNLIHLLKQEAKTILLTSHDLEEIGKVADFISMIKNGNLLFTKDKTEFKDNDLEELFITMDQAILS